MNDVFNIIFCPMPLNLKSCDYNIGVSIREYKLKYGNSKVTVSKVKEYLVGRLFVGNRNANVCKFLQ
jgi:hypothetical protein